MNGTQSKSHHQNRTGRLQVGEPPWSVPSFSKVWNGEESGGDAEGKCHSPVPGKRNAVSKRESNHKNEWRDKCKQKEQASALPIVEPSAPHIGDSRLSLNGNVLPFWFTISCGSAGIWHRANPAFPLSASPFRHDHFVSLVEMQRRCETPGGRIPGTKSQTYLGTWTLTQRVSSSLMQRGKHFIHGRPSYTDR